MLIRLMLSTSGQKKIQLAQSTGQERPRVQGAQKYSKNEE